MWAKRKPNATYNPGISNMTKFPKLKTSEEVKQEGRDSWYLYMIESNEETREGHQRPDEYCPYPIGHKLRCDWWIGWYEARINYRLKHVFVKYGLSFP